MAKDFAKSFYKSKQWRKCRASYISMRQAIDGGMCETCHRVPGVIVHHRVWLTADNINDPDISLNHKLLKLDCIECHNRESEIEERYVFDDGGQVVPSTPLKNKCSNYFGNRDGDFR